MHIRENKESKAIKQFSRFAHTYDTYNIIQSEVARELVDRLSSKTYNTILDIGCGSGAIYKNIIKKKIEFKSFIALDSAEEMLAIHPKEEKIYKYCADFNLLETYKGIEVLSKESLLLSSSALQWSQNLDFSFRQLSQKAAKAYFAIFTSKTFKTLHSTGKIKSPIYSTSELKENIEKHYVASFELKEYRLEFKTVKDMFKYIKKSGVSGGEKQLTYKQTKQLIKSYPLKYLEFEVLFVEATSLVNSSEV